MNFILKIIGLIPVRKLLKYLPEILAFILTQVMQFAAKKKPELLEVILKYAEKITRVAKVAIEAASDGVIDAQEVKAIAAAYKKEL